ncbi:MAG TPA: AsmA family protein, partial [Dissulfurispiraceae bacterium]
MSMTPQKKKICMAAAGLLAVSAVLLLSLVYTRFLDLKREALGLIAASITSSVGQKVGIQDISLSPVSGITLYGITMSNPEGFSPGQLLRIKRLRLDMRLSELLKGSLHLRSIIISSPELSIMRDRDGRLNISDGLRSFLSKKSSRTYRVDEFVVESGSFDFNRDESYRLDNIGLKIKGLSSSPSERSSIEGSIRYAGLRMMEPCTLKISGWAYLKGDPQKLKLSISSKDLALKGRPAYFAFLDRYGIRPGSARIAASLDIEGDTGKGVALKPVIGMSRTGSFFARKDTKALSLAADAFLDIRGRSLLVRELSLHAGDISTVRLKGMVKETPGGLSYDALAKVERLDLSAFDFAED